MNIVGDTPQIPGYRLIRKLYEGERVLVYQAVQVSDQLPVAIKFLRSDRPNFNELERLRNQYDITHKLHSPGVVAVYAMEPVANSYALIMEDFGGISLSQYTRRQTMSLSAVLQFALQMVEVLDYLYHQRIVHRDINPANILINPISKQVKLADFGIAATLPEGSGEIPPTSYLEGTLAYMAPEQSGRMNCGVDHRSDYYSLGITLYELLANQQPFSADKPLDWLHCHIAQAPELLHQVNPSVPALVSEIVMKLMSKNAADRYQSPVGLKHDLKQCLVRWQSTGAIASFTLATHDVSDRFVIPEKLYGRDAEVLTLLSAFSRIASPPKKQSLTQAELVLISGSAGVGKTALVEAIHQPIARRGSYFISGKFDQFNRNVPLSGFIQALQNFMLQLLTESDEQLAQWSNRILDAVGKNGQVLIDVIPALEKIIGPQPAVPHLSGIAVENRFNLLFKKFVAALTCHEHPLVIFLDDLQWADTASLQLVQLLLTTQGHLLLLGAYREEEVSASHPLMLMMGELQETYQSLRTISLRPLSAAESNQLVARTLQCSTQRSQPLAALIHRKTKGSPFFTVQFLKALYQDGYITFNRKRYYWECDLAQVSALSMTDDVVEFMVQRLQKLPDSIQTLLKLAACIGSQFDVRTVALVAEVSEAETTEKLQYACKEGLISPQTDRYSFYFEKGKTGVAASKGLEGSYRFLHDRIQQAAYALIPDKDKQTIHYRIGKLLLAQISKEVREEHVYELLTHLNQGIIELYDAEDRLELAKLNLAACQKARASTAYQAGLDYAKSGLGLLGSTAWDQNYEMCLVFHDLAAELTFLSGDFAAMEQLIQTVHSNAHSLLDEVNAVCLKVLANVSQNQLTEALQLAIQMLQRLGVSVPLSPQPHDVQQALLRVTDSLQDISIQELSSLPSASDKRIIAIAQISKCVIPVAFISGSPLFPLLVSSLVHQSILQGNTPESAVAYAGYGLLACNQMNAVEIGAKFGQLALDIVSQLDAKAIEPEVCTVVGFFLLHRQHPIRQTLPVLKKGYAVALETGNLEYVGYNAHNYCFNAFWSGQPLDTLREETEAFTLQLIQLKQFTTTQYCQIYWQAILKLTDITEGLKTFSGQIFDEEEFLSKLKTANDILGLSFFYLFKLFICFVFDEDALVRYYLNSLSQFIDCIPGTVGTALYYYFDSLSVLRKLDLDAQIQPEILAKVSRNQSFLQENWADHAPINYQNKVDLVAAEQSRVLGQVSDAIEFYDRAIAGAKQGGFLHEEALANELAAKFYLAWGKPKLASVYMQDAYNCYARWGAVTKIAHLEQTYPELLAAILTPIISSAHSQDALLSWPRIAQGNDTQKIWLDFPSVIQAAQAISEEIALDQLLVTLIKILIADAGAQQGSLIVNRDKQWCVAAQASTDSAEVLDHPLDSYDQLPRSLIFSVKRSEETAVFENLSLIETFASDPYIQRHHPKSVLCAPMHRKGKLLGIVYLENNLTVGAFTEEHLEILQFLMQQAAISLENALLYHQTESYSQTLEVEVEKKTQALNERAEDLGYALIQLQQTNQELAEATRLKDEFLANMSHELRTPLNAILGMTESLQDKVFGELNDKQIRALQTVERSGSHLLALINDVLDVAKIESGHFELNYTSTAVIPLCRLSLIFIKQQALRKGIQLDFRHPSYLPDLLLDERRIRQVLINLLSNAVKFTPEGGSITLEICYPHVVSQSEFDQQTDISHYLRISVRDTGIGIAPESAKKLFQPFIQIDSSLNRQYAGTGLGLALVKRIVELHKGKVALESTLGVGSCFTVDLPCYQTEDLSAPLGTSPSNSYSQSANSPAASVPHRSPLVLLAEDNEANICTLSSYLSARGFQTLLAKNGLEAIALAKQEHPDVVLMDIQMPQVDGIEAIRQIRQDSRLSTIPIIALTALAMDGDRERCLAAGATDYLSKPVKLKQLVSKIQELYA